MFDFLGPTTVYVGPTADELAQIVAAQLDAALTPIKADLADLKENLMALNDEIGQLKTDLNAVFSDLSAKLFRLQEVIDHPDNSSKLDATGQALFDDIKASVANVRTTVGDEDGDGTPAPEGDTGDNSGEGDGGTAEGDTGESTEA